MKNPNFSVFIAVAICLGLVTSMAFAEMSARKHFGKGNPFTVEELFFEDGSEVRDINQTPKL
jgi:hypothetical protein